MDDYHVYVNNGIKEIHEEATEEDGTGFDGWEIEEQLIYDKNEYLKLITEEKDALAEEVTSLQVALVEVYESTLA